MPFFLSYQALQAALTEELEETELTRLKREARLLYEALSMTKQRPKEGVRVSVDLDKFGEEASLPMSILP